MAKASDQSATKSASRYTYAQATSRTNRTPGGFVGGARAAAVRNRPPGAGIHWYTAEMIQQLSGTIRSRAG
jgi:hypothetical protein